MSPRQQPTSRRYKDEGNADPAREHQAPLTISPGQNSPANQQHKGNDFFTGAPTGRPMRRRGRSCYRSVAQFSRTALWRSGFDSNWR
jgi:hypothetical protein